MNLNRLAKYLSKLKKALKQTLAPQPKIRYLSSYMEWYNDVGWLTRIDRDGMVAHYHASK